MEKVKDNSVSWARPHKETTNKQKEDLFISKIPLSCYSTTTSFNSGNKQERNTKYSIPTPVVSTFSSGVLNKNSWGTPQPINYGNILSHASNLPKNICNQEKNDILTSTTNSETTSFQPQPLLKKTLPLFINPSMIAVSNKIPTSPKVSKKERVIPHSQSNSSIPSFLESRINLNSSPSMSFLSSSQISSEKHQNKNNSETTNRFSDEGNKESHINKESKEIAFPIHDKNESKNDVKTQEDFSSKEKIKKTNEKSSDVKETASIHTFDLNSFKDFINQNSEAKLILPSNDNQNTTTFNLQQIVKQIQNRPDVPDQEIKEQFIPPIFRKNDSKSTAFITDSSPSNDFEKSLMESHSKKGKFSLFYKLQKKNKRKTKLRSSSKKSQKSTTNSNSHKDESFVSDGYLTSDDISFPIIDDNVLKEIKEKFHEKFENDSLNLDEALIPSVHKCLTQNDDISSQKVKKRPSHKPKSHKQNPNKLVALTPEKPDFS